MDDRSGAIFELSINGTLIPRFILSEGDGNSPKGMKIEWASEKNGNLIVGGFGSEYVGKSAKADCQVEIVVYAIPNFIELTKQQMLFFRIIDW